MAKQYTIGQTKQLIDLNENLINFKIQFRVSSTIPPPDCPPFEVGIIPQSQLNTSPDDIQLQQVTNGEFSGEIENTNGVYQSWYLVLKAPEECNVMVQLAKEEVMPVAKDTPLPVQQPATSSSYRTIMIVVVVIALVGAGWWFYFRKQEEGGDSPVQSLEASGEASSKESADDSDEGVFSPSAKFAMSPTSAKILDRIK